MIVTSRGSEVQVFLRRRSNPKPARAAPRIERVAGSGVEVTMTLNPPVGGSSKVKNVVPPGASGVANVSTTEFALNGPKVLLGPE